MKQRESKDVTQKNLESYPDGAADILNVFIHEEKQEAQAALLLPAPTETEYTAPAAHCGISWKTFQSTRCRMTGRLDLSLDETRNNNADVFCSFFLLRFVKSLPSDSCSHIHFPAHT